MNGASGGRFHAAPVIFRNGNMKINVRLSATNHAFLRQGSGAGRRSGEIPLENFDKLSGFGPGV